MRSFKAISDARVREGPGTKFAIMDTLNEGDVITEMAFPELKAWCPIEMDDGSPGWVFRGLLAPADPEDTTPPLPPLAGEPPWITWARKQMGEREVPGPESNPVIEAWYHLTTLPEYLWTDGTAWCAVFVNAALMLSNIKTPRSARAFDWLTYGVGVDTPRKGDLVIFDFSHIAFYIADASATKINCLGGNQSDMVNITAFNKSAVKAYRRVPNG